LQNLVELYDLELYSNKVPNTDAAWAPVHNLPNNPKGEYAWDSESVRKSQKY
jgi:hypothetical protein